MGTPLTQFRRILRLSQNYQPKVLLFLVKSIMLMHLVTLSVIYILAGSWRELIFHAKSDFVRQTSIDSWNIK